MSYLPVSDMPLLVKAWMKSPNYIEMNDRQKVLFVTVCDEPGPHHVRDLARAMGLDKSVVSRTCDKLVEAGLMRRETCADRRDCTLEPTSRGYEIRACMRALLVN